MARHFNGISDKLSSASDDFNFERTEQFSVFLFIKYTGGTFVIGRSLSGPTSQGWGIQQGIIAGTVMQVQLANNEAAGVNALRVLSVNGLPKDTWSYIGFTYAGTSTPAGIKIYFNDVVSPATTELNTLTASIQAVTSLWLGARGGSELWYNGDMAHAAIWRGVELTQDDIRKLIRTKEPRLVRPQWLKGYWYLNWRHASEPDLSGHNNNLTVVGTSSADDPASGIIQPPLSQAINPMSKVAVGWCRN